MLTLWTFPLKIFKKIIHRDAYYLNLSEFLSNVQLTFWAVFMHERNRKTVLQVSTYHFVQQLFCQVKVRWVDDLSCNTNFITSGHNRGKKSYQQPIMQSAPAKHTLKKGFYLENFKEVLNQLIYRNSPFGQEPIWAGLLWINNRISKLFF